MKKVLVVSDEIHFTINAMKKIFNDNISEKSPELGRPFTNDKVIDFLIELWARKENDEVLQKLTDMLNVYDEGKK